jgi:hypothetical protein
MNSKYGSLPAMENTAKTIILRQGSCMPGILSFLAQVYEREIKQKETKEMISSCMPFLLQNEYENDRGGCFPTSIDVDKNNKQEKPGSRLAWCYGDLCIANALIHCGRALNHTDWKTKGIDVALKTTRRGLKVLAAWMPLFVMEQLDWFINTIVFIV